MMKSFYCYFFLLLALIGICYFLSHKDEPVVVNDDVALPVEEKTVHAEALPMSPPKEPIKEPVEVPEKEIVKLPAKERVKVPVKETKIEPVADPYYKSVAGASGDELKNRLHKIIRGHRALTYGELWEALRDLDRGDEGSVILIYDRTQRSHSKNGGDQGDWNREHLWPRGYGVRRSNSANTDLHHIRASDVRINGNRGHLYFDETEGDDFAGKKYSADTDSWEPPNVVKGDIARALFYMAVRYEGNEEGNEAGSIDLELSDSPSMETGVHGKLSVLLKWHKNDPVSDLEKVRNNKIHRSYQGNRNPFIDHPEWADGVFK